jgi:hypothetical protein
VPFILEVALEKVAVGGTTRLWNGCLKRNVLCPTASNYPSEKYFESFECFFEDFAVYQLAKRESFILHHRIAKETK